MNTIIYTSRMLVSIILGTILLGCNFEPEGTTTMISQNGDCTTYKVSAPRVYGDYIYYTKCGNQVADHKQNCHPVGRSVVCDTDNPVIQCCPNEKESK